MWYLFNFNLGFNTDILTYSQGSFRVYPLSDDPGVQPPPRQFRELPESGPQECVVRIYVLRGIDMQPKDSNGMVSLQKTCINLRLFYVINQCWLVGFCLHICFCFFQCDPYLKITLGKKTIDDRDHYKPNTLNPEFGRSDIIECYMT